ncbi:MAG: hypothetical protein SFV23_11995 [Planctomycetaceae bacterium]|nr:hypothetical protein [Planctomycetaceae bacterium]
MHVTQRIDQYNPARAARATFVDRVSHNKVLNIIEGRRAIKRGGGRPPEPLDDEHAVALEFGSTSADLDRQLDIGEAIARLPEDLRIVALQLGLEGPAEAARSLGLTPGQMRSRMAAIAAHLRDAGLGEKF